MLLEQKIIIQEVTLYILHFSTVHIHGSKKYKIWLTVWKISLIQGSYTSWKQAKTIRYFILFCLPKILRILVKEKYVTYGKWKIQLLTVWICWFLQGLQLYVHGRVRVMQRTDAICIIRLVLLTISFNLTQYILNDETSIHSLFLSFVSSYSQKTERQSGNTGQTGSFFFIT